MTAAPDLFAPPAMPARPSPKTDTMFLTKNPNGAYRCCAAVGGVPCGADAHFGFGRRRDEPLAGVWYCFSHRELGG